MVIGLSQLAKHLGLDWTGVLDPAISGIGTLQGAHAGQISFLANPLYRKYLAATKASAVIVRQADAAACPVPFLIAKDPYQAFAQVAALFDTKAEIEPGIHPTAIISETAVIAADASIGPFVSIGARSQIKAGVVVGPNCVIGDDCIVGAGSELVARVTLVTRVRLGERVRIHPGAVLGADGFGLAMQEGRWCNVPQLGGVVIGDDCEIGANSTIDRGAIENTILEDDVRLDNQIQIGHNVIIGAHTAMAGCAAVAGSAKIGRYCLIGGGVGIVGHIEICDRVTITAMSLVTHSICEPGEYSSGTPLQPSRPWRRNAVRFKHLDELARKIAATPTDKD